MRVPIQGGRGIGYRLRSGFDLPPLMFSIEETEAIVLALALLERTGDVALKKSVRRVSQKIAAVSPPLRQVLVANTLHAWGTVAQTPSGIDRAVVRAAIRDERKMEIGYCDEHGRRTERTIRPIGLIYYSETANIVARCELRQDLRHFRSDRVENAVQMEAYFKGKGDELRRQWISSWTDSRGMRD
jgi:predicted DNA-binding transcriptional regulator YafY